MSENYQVSINKVNDTLYTINCPQIQVSTHGTSQEDAIFNLKVVNAWIDAGSPLPPPHVIKQTDVINAGLQHDLKVLVETGTCEGKMIEVCKGIYREIFSIELSEELHAKAQVKFRNDKNVSLFCGDSGDLLPKVLEQVDEPCIFWLDAHYSGGFTAKAAIDTPIEQELKTIFAFPHPFIALIDDARLFVGKDNYPTVDQMVSLFKAAVPNVTCSFEHDILSFNCLDR